MITTVVLTVCAVLAVVGLILLLAALTPRRIDDNPLCAKCGFDLIGHPELNHCPECGSRSALTLTFVHRGS